MAATKIRVEQLINADGWIPVNDTWSYSSVDGPTGVITIPTDGTTKYSVGMRVKLTQTSVKYFIVTAVAATTLTVYGGTDYTLANAAISAISFSMVKAPLGFPLSPVKWTEILTDTGTRSQATPTTGTWYNPGSLSLTVPIGVWTVSYNASFGANEGGGAQSIEIRSTLSTANNSTVDAAMTAGIYSFAATDPRITFYRETIYTLAAKQTYYLNVAVITGTNIDNLYTLGGVYGSTVIKAVCAYL